MSEMGQVVGGDAVANTPPPGLLGGVTDEITELFAALAERIETSERRCTQAFTEMEQRLQQIEVAPPRPAAPRNDAPSDEPWDRESAEALAQVYEAQDPDFVHHSTDQDDSTYGRPWIGPRFAEISARIKQSLADMRPQSPALALEPRFDRLEERISVAVETLARRSDVEGLHLIESHVHDLSGRVDAVQVELSRLDGVENQLRGIMERLSDERLAEVLANDGRFAAGLEAAARMAAGEVQALLAADLSGGDANARHEELRGLIENAIVEQRRGEESTSSLVGGLGHAVAEQADRYDALKSLLETSLLERREGDGQTIAMLDTLQQALVQVLDRIDAIEAGQQASGHDRAGAGHQAVAATGSTANTGADWGAPGPALTSTSSGAASRRVPGGVAPAHNTPPTTGTGSHELSDGGAAAENDLSPVEKLRREFMVDAQSAKLKASGQGDLGDAKHSRGGAQGAAKALAQGKILGVSPVLLAGALALGVAINGGVMLWSRMPAPDAASSAVLSPASDDRGVDESTGASLNGAREQVAPDMLNKTAEGETGVERTADSGAPPAGVVVHSSPQPVSEEQLAYSYEQQALADLSAEAANSAANATMAALVPEQDGRVAALNRAPGPAGRDNTNTRTSMLDLPPATVGPFSLRMAAAKGDKSAEFEVGARLAEGKGTEQNLKEAARWYRKSASKSFAQAQYRLGTLYERGLGVAADTKRARVWYERAAKQGNIKAMHNLAVLSAGGDSSAPNYTAAVRWFQGAAEYGLTDSQFNLGVLCESGLGTAKDPVKAYKWYALSARSGDKDALQRRDQLKADLAPADLKNAQALVASFRVKTPDKLANDARAAGEDWKNRQAGEGSG
jgi:localization factor PodJL